VLTELQDALDFSEQYAHPLTAEFVLCESNRFGEVTRRLTPFLRDAGLDWGGLDAVLKVRQELFEIDTRFGQLGGGGLFSRLDGSGVLTHHVSEVDGIEAAMTQPPGVGRARIRGNAVKKLAGQNGHFQCDWQGVFDVTAKRVLDLSEPLESSERWVRFDESHNVPLPFLDTYARY
jgi:hypothetical protein